MIEYFIVSPIDLLAPIDRNRFFEIKHEILRYTEADIRIPTPEENVHLRRAVDGATRSNEDAELFLTALQREYPRIQFQITSETDDAATEIIFYSSIAGKS